MDNSNLYNTGTGLSGLDNGYFQQITADQIIVESNLQLPNGLTLPTDILPLQNNRDALNALPSGEVIVKGSSDDTYSSIPTSNDFSTTTNDIVRKTAGRINSNKISVGDDTSTLGDVNIKKTSGNSELFLISPSSNIPRLYLIRNAGSDSFSGDGASDWAIMNASGNIVFERGNSLLNNGYLTPFRITYYNTIELNYYNSGAIVDVCPLRHYRQVNGNLNSYYVDVRPSSNVAGAYTHYLPAETGTYITDATTEYVNLNTMNTNINAQTNNNLLIKTGTNTFSSTANNSSNWDTAYTDSQQNKSDILTIKGAGWTNETIKQNADDIATNQSNIATNTAWRSDFNTQTTNNLLFRDGTDSFNNIGVDNGFGSGSLIVKKDSGTIKSQNFLAEQAGNGYMFQSFSNPAVISYLYHSTNSGLGVAVEMPSTSGQLALTSQISPYWDINASNNIYNINSGGRVGIGTSNPQELLEVSGDAPKIRIYDGTSTRNPALEFVRGSTSFGSDGFHDWRVHDQGGNLKFYGESTGATGGVNGNSLWLGFNGKNGLRVDNPNAVLSIGASTNQSHFSYGTDEHTYIRGGKNTSSVFIADTGVKRARIGDSAIGAEGTLDIIGNGSNSHFNYGTNNSTYIRAGSTLADVYIADNTASGKVGILTNSINASFDCHIDGSSLISDNFKVTGEGLFAQDNEFKIQTDASNGVKLSLQSNGGTTDYMKIGSYNSINNIQNYNRDLVIYGGSTATDEVARFKSNYMELQNAVHDKLRFTNTTTAGSYNYMSFYDGASTRVYYVGQDGGNNGDFMIGTESSGRSLLIDKNNGDFKIQKNTNVAGTFTANSTATFQGLSIMENTLTILNAGPNLILRDTTDSDDIQVRFDGLYSGSNQTNARITTTSNYLNLETTNNAPMQGIIIKTNLTNAITIDNNQNVELSGGLGIGITPSLKLTVAPVNSNDSMVIKGHYNNIDTFLGCGGNVPQSGPVYRDSILACGNGSGGGTAGTTYGIINGFRQAYIESLGTYSFQSHNNSTTPTNIIQLHKSSGNVDINTGSLDIQSGNLDVNGAILSKGSASELSIVSRSSPSTKAWTIYSSSGDLQFYHQASGVDRLKVDSSGNVDIQSGNLEVRSGTSGAGVYAEVGIAKIGNGISNYAMFSHKDQHSVQNYALLQSDLGDTFINAKLNRKIHFRINNNDIGTFDNTSGAEKTEFTFPNFLGIYPTFDTSGKPVSNFCSLDNPSFRVYNALARQGHTILMYNQVVCDASTSGFTQCPFPTIAYGTQPGYPSGFPGNAFRMCDPNDYIEIDMHFSGYTSSTNGLQTIILQFFARTTSGTGVWTNIFQESFYINDRYQHVYLSVSKYVQLTHSFYTHARIITSGGTFTGDSGDFFKLVVRNVPRQSR